MKRFCTNGNPKLGRLGVTNIRLKQAVQQELSQVNALTSERISQSQIYNRRSQLQVEELRLSEWNGFVELTDECKFGLALFKLRSPNISTTVSVPLKDHTIEREVKITFLKDIGVTRIAFHDEGYVSMPMPYIDAFNRKAIMQYIHESRLVSGLIRDIHDKKSARDRWIPNFIDSIEEIERVLNGDKFLCFDLPPILNEQGANFQFNTIGQYLLLAMCERMRKRTKSGLGLRCLFYAISLIARFALDGNSTSLSALVIHVALWISEGTCDDCLIKLMRLLRGKTQCEYNLYLDDSFSKYITFKNSETIDLNFGTDCVSRGISNTSPNFQRISVRTIGTHGFLTSPEAGRRTVAYVQFTKDYPTVKLCITVRQIISLRSILDLHARVIRAHSWDQSVHAFNAWFAERRIDIDSNVNDLLDIMITDLMEIRKINQSTQALTSHLICLLIKGVLPREMIAAYNQRPRNERAHEFLVRFVFHISPSSITMKHAELLFKRLETSTPEERRLEISFTLENPRHTYSVCPPDEVGELAQYIRSTSTSPEISPIHEEMSAIVEDDDEEGKLDSARALPDLPDFLRKTSHKPGNDTLNDEEMITTLDSMGLHYTQKYLEDDTSGSKDHKMFMHHSVLNHSTTG